MKNKKEDTENYNTEGTDWIHKDELCWYLEQKQSDQNLFQKGI